ncbi:MAG TPA: response regulator [Candidatus Methanoperedens sp.]|nr:response regulator [Candidatus Methanoperedens sp.]
MSRGTILVVEKDAFYASFYEQLLTREGYRVIHAESVAEGLRLYREQPCEVVISDMVLGAEDGLALLETIKAANPRQDVVMITSMQSLRKAVEALKRGASDYLTKPVDGDELLLLLRMLIERQALSQEHARLIGENVLFAEQLRVQRRGLELLALLDVDRIIDHLLDLVIAETGAAWAALFFHREDDDAFVFGARRGIHDVRLERPETGFATGALREQFFRGRAVLEDRDGAQLPEGSPRGGHRFRIPLRTRGRVTGLIVVGPRRDESPHREHQVAVARVIAESGAIALENARSYALEAARDVHDPVTGTYSPVYFRQAGEKEVNIAHRYGRSVSAVVIQLDSYGAVKAALKEAQARQMLREFAAKVLEVARETDIVAMLEEGLFAAIVPETDYYGSLMFMKRLRAALRGMVFSVDLTRELRPRATMGAASYPRDGEQLVTILRRARERLAQDRASVVRRLELEERSFWSAFAHLIGLGETPAPPPAGDWLTLTTVEIDQVRNLFLEEVGRLGGTRGLVYIGVQSVDSGTFSYSGFSRLAGSRTSVFCLGARGPGGWSHPEITPVYLADEQIAANRFLICVTEHSYYTCLCRPEGPESWRVFHSADPFLAQELIGKLQERYLLQQRVG